MSQTQRHKRVRLLVKKLNKDRKRQASKVDILCNDLIAAQREFIRRLNAVSFAAHFYKGLLGAGDLRTLLVRAGRLIAEEMPGTRVMFFLRQGESCEPYVCDWAAAPIADEIRLEEYLTPKLAAAICKSNRLHTMDDLLGLGLETNRKDLNGLSAVTVPLTDLGRPLGFSLLCRPAAQPLQPDELHRVGLIACGLSQAIRASSTVLHARD